MSDNTEPLVRCDTCYFWTKGYCRTKAEKTSGSDGCGLWNSQGRDSPPERKGPSKAAWARLKAAVGGDGQ